MTDHDRNERLGRTAGESTYVRFALRREYHDDDPGVQRQLRQRPSRPRPVWWVRWLVAGVTVGVLVAVAATLLSTPNDDQALGRVALAALGGAVAGWWTVVLLARSGVFRRTDEI